MGDGDLSSTPKPALSKYFSPRAPTRKHVLKRRAMVLAILGNNALLELDPKSVQLNTQVNKKWPPSAPVSK